MNGRRHQRYMVASPVDIEARSSTPRAAGHHPGGDEDLTAILVPDHPPKISRVGNTRPLASESLYMGIAASGHGMGPASMVVADVIAMARRALAYAKQRRLLRWAVCVAIVVPGLMGWLG